MRFSGLIQLPRVAVFESKTMKQKFLLCIDNEGYKASLEIRKLYETIPDKEAERHNQVRIIDESGEDYLYPASYREFVNSQEGYFCQKHKRRLNG